MRKLFGKAEGVFYIGGSDVFPPPLKPEEEAVLLKQLIEAGVMIGGFVRERGNLESVFLQIINHEEGMVLISEN